ncbi:type I pullulanase [Clostridiales bacterium COT073_COT-073]|nr:type I pullulanase [Clostridiales bacterium COT073_COT-073]
MNHKIKIQLSNPFIHLTFRRLLSWLLILTIFFSLPISTTSVYAENSGRYIQVQYNTDRDSFDFKIKADGADYAYIRGDFTDNWAIQEEFKAVRRDEDNDKTGEMLLTVPAEKTENTGHQYKAYIYYADESQVPAEIRDGGNPHFGWMTADGWNQNSNENLPARDFKANRSVMTEYQPSVAGAEDKVTFKIKANKAKHGYVMCDGNDWNVNTAEEKYKFTRTADDIREVELMQVQIDYRDLIKGEHNQGYKVVLSYDGHSYEWMNAEGDSSGSAPNSSLPDRTGMPQIPNPGGQADRTVMTEYDQADDAVIFKLKADGYDYAYLMCQANNWTEADSYKMERDSSDTEKKEILSLTLPYAQLISREQMYQYKVKLYKSGQPDGEWINAEGNNGDNSLFPESPITLPANVPFSPDQKSVQTIYHAGQSGQENKVEFRIKADGIDEAYVMCKANQWATDNLADLADYKAIRHKNDGNKNGLLTVTIPYSKLSSTEQKYEYKIYAKSNGNAIWFNAEGLDANNSFFPTENNGEFGEIIHSAVMDEKDKIKVYLKPEYQNLDITYDIWVDDVKYPAIIESQDFLDIEVEYQNPWHLRRVTLDISQLWQRPDFDIRKSLQVSRHGSQDKTKVLKRRVLDHYLYQGNDLGISFAEDTIGIKLWTPAAGKVELLTYDSYTSENFEVDKLSPDTITEMDYDSDTGIYYTELNKEFNENKFYLFRLTFGDQVKYAVDPYAVAVGINGKMGALVDINAPDTKPAGFEMDSKPALAEPEDSILYEMHIRDFTINSDWGGKPEHAGKYLGLIEAGTKYQANGQSVSTGLDHLKELGITHVHLLPTYDFVSTDESRPAPYDDQSPYEQASQRNWGYDPLNYNVPEGSYATNAADPKVRIKEYRQMVMGLHQAGIRVVKDVVYNHMAGMENMNNIAEGYYFRTWEEGTYSNDSGCGNAIESEHLMVRKFIVDSCNHWVENYNIDGLRFDLMAILDTTTMNQVKQQVRQKDNSILVYGEPWMADRSPLPWDRRTEKNKGLSFFNDTYRDALRGNNSPSKGYVTGEMTTNLTNVLRGLKAEDAGDPEEIINYVEAHDNYAIWDQVEKSELGTINGQFRLNIPTNAFDDWRVDKAVLANGFVLLSQGIPFYQGGSEILRTKQGDHNSYKSNDAVNDYDWADKAEFKEVFEYYQGLIQIRKAQSLLRLTSKAKITAHQEVNRLNDRDDMIYQYLHDNPVDGEWKNMVILYNASNQEQPITWLPGSQSAWKVAADDQGVYMDLPEADRRVVEKQGSQFAFKMAANSLMILYSFEEAVAPANIHWHYLFADQSRDYMSPLEPGIDDEITVRFRSKAGELTAAELHYYVEGDPQVKVVAMREAAEDFYTSRGYDKNKLTFYEATIPAGAANKYYHFKAINQVAADNVKVAWIGAGEGEDHRGISNQQLAQGFPIVPGYKTSKWSKESIFYQIMVDRFRDGDSQNNKVKYDFAKNGDRPELSAWGSEIYKGTESDGIWNNQFFGGDLIGVKEAIPYLKNTLGVDALYLMPIFQSDSDHKYDNDTYEYIDANFGGNLALAELGADLKGNGLNYILDGAFNHSSSSGQLFKEHRDFFFKGKWQDENGVEYDHYPWHQKYFNFAKLDYSQAKTKDYIYAGDEAIAKRYLKAPYYAGGWRLDAAEDVSEIARDYKENEIIDPVQKASNLKIWQDFAHQVRTADKDAFILGEYWGNENHWYYGKAWDGKMNYGGFYLPFIENQSKNPWLGKHSLDNKGEMSVADIAKFTRNYMKDFPYATILSSTNSLSTHDKPRFLNVDYVGQDNTAMMVLAQTLQMTTPGIPLIYYGDEIGSFGKGDGSDPYNRQTFNWNDDQWNYQILNNYRKLIAARKQNKDAFVYGAFEEVQSHHHQKYVVYARYAGDQKAIVILNNNGSNGSRIITLQDMDRFGLAEGTKLVDIFTGEQFMAEGNALKINSQDMSARCLVLESNYTLVEDLNATFDVNTVLADGKDQRHQLTAPLTPVYQKTEDGKVTVTYDLIDQTGVKGVLVRAVSRDDSRELAKVEMPKTEKRVVFDNLPADFKLVIKTVADRDEKSGQVGDKYQDSGYVEVALKTENTPSDPNPGNPQDPGQPNDPNPGNPQDPGQPNDPNPGNPQQPGNNQQPSTPGSFKPADNSGSDKIQSDLPEKPQMVIKNGKTYAEISLKSKEHKEAEIKLSKTGLQEILSKEAEGLKIQTPMAEVHLTKGLLQKIQTASNEQTQITLKQYAKSDVVSQLKSIQVKTDLLEIRIENETSQKVWPQKEKIYVSIPYLLKAGEDKNQLLAFGLGKDGQITEIAASIYDAQRNRMIVAISPEMKIGVASKSVSGSRFTDTENHYAKAEIDFVSARGLMQGVGNGRFAAQNQMDRAMLVAVLGRLAGIDPADYQTSVFSDVPAGAYYAPYVTWAYQAGLVKGIGLNQYAPTMNLTREQTAVILAGFIEKYGYQLPVQQTAAFTDADTISDYAKSSVQALQEAGIVKGKGANFDAKAEISRAEISIMLKRLIELQMLQIQF